ncbi:MAG: hypothetical protein KC736_02885 [Candidatus Moranbacteria bacterium]|nr:hypothetical protein [Candidatus Moranbacteria bacterium]
MRIRYFLFIFLAVFSLSFFPTHRAQACFWSDAICAEFIHEAWREAYDEIQAYLLASAKQAAVESVYNLVNGFLGDFVITDFQDYLDTTEFQDAALRAKLIQRHRGTASSANYESNPLYEGVASAESAYDDLRNLPQSFSEYAENQVRGLLKNSPSDWTRVESVCNDWKNLDSFRCLNTVVDAHPLKESAVIASEIQAEAENLQKTLTVMATSSGFIPKVDSSGKVQTPAAILEGIAVKAHTAVQSIIEAATNWQEVLAGLTTAYAKKAIDQGIDSLQREFDQQLSKSLSQYRGFWYDEFGVNDPRPLFDDLYNQTNLVSNQSTERTYSTTKPGAGEACSARQTSGVCKSTCGEEEISAYNICGSGLCCLPPAK